MRTLRGDYDDALAQYQAALGYVRGRDSLWEARLLRKQADVCQLQHELDAALRLYDEAEAALDSNAAVSVEAEPWLTFTPADPAATGLIFYPGGRVPAEAYAPWLEIGHLFLPADAILEPPLSSPSSPRPSARGAQTSSSGLPR